MTADKVIDIKYAVHKAWYLPKFVKSFILEIVGDAYLDQYKSTYQKLNATRRLIYAEKRRRFNQ